MSHRHPPPRRPTRSPNRALKQNKQDNWRNQDRSPILQINARTASSQRNAMPIVVAFIAALLFFVVAIYVGRSIYAALTPGIATEVVRMGNMDDPRSVTGMIIRYEEVVYATRAGRVVFAVNETERVRGGTPVASIQDVDAVVRANEGLLSTEREIMMISEWRISYEADVNVQRLDASLSNAINNSMHNFSTANLTEINVLHERLTQLIDNRNQMIISSNLAAVGDIGRLHDQYATQIERASYTIYAPSSGIMFPIIDGLEYEVTPRNMYTLTRDGVLFSVDPAIMFPTRDVQAGDPVFKIVGNNWYVAAYMPTEMIQGFITGSEQTIFLQNIVSGEYVPMVMRVEYVEHFHRDSFIIFRGTRNAVDFLYQRNVSIRTTDDVASGLKIPNSAIAVRRFIRIPVTHVHGIDAYSVFHNAEYGARSIPIEVSEQTETHVYVLAESLELIMGDSLLSVVLGGEPFIITESSVREIYGVYRATLGYANFTTINLDGRLSDVDGGHTLLSPARNPNLVQFDIIVTDASTVTHWQIIN